MDYFILAYYKDSWEGFLGRSDTHVIGVVYDAPEGLSQEEVFRMGIEKGHIHPSEFGPLEPINPEAVWAVPCPEYFDRIERGVIPVKEILRLY